MVIATFIIVIFLLIIIGQFRENNGSLHSHWSQLLPSFKYSTMEFYELTKAEMLSHGIEQISFKEEKLKTGHILSSERIYLRVLWKDYYYDICFAPFGDGCFVSWWLFQEKSSGEVFFTNLPFIGGWIGRAFYKKTCYQIDTSSMFMTYAHQSVLSVVDQITKGSGFRIDDNDRKPVLYDISIR